MMRTTKRSLHSRRNRLAAVAMALSLLAMCIGQAWAGPLKDAAVAALREVGKQAVTNIQDRKLDQEPDALRDCMLVIFGNPNAPSPTPYSEAKTFLQTQRRLDLDRASDIAMSSLIDICEVHVIRPYTDLVRAYYTAVNNRANNVFTRYQRRFLACDSVEEQANRCTSSPAAADRVRLPGELTAARSAYCALEPMARSALRLRAMLGAKFSDVGRELGMSAQQAHDLYHNALRRVQSQLRARCYMD